MGMSGRLLRPRATGFNPRSISGLAAWWDFNDSATVTIDTGISAVLDKSGNSRTLLQATANNQPTWTPSAINGKYAADFNGTTNRLRASFTLSQPFTLFVVGRFNGTNPSSNQTMIDGFAGGNRARVFWYDSLATSLSMNGGSGLSLPTSPAADALANAVYESVLDGASSFFGWNGSPTVTGNAGTAAPDGITIGAFGTGNTAFGQVTVANVLLYGAALSAAQRSTIRRWLASLYALTVV